jgi:hypothetical protein
VTYSIDHDYTSQVDDRHVRVYTPSELKNSFKNVAYSLQLHHETSRTGYIFAGEHV